MEAKIKERSPRPAARRQRTGKFKLTVGRPIRWTAGGDALRCCVCVTLFPEAPKEVREFATLKEASTFAFHKRQALRGEFYTIEIYPAGRQGSNLEILIGKIYRGLNNG